MKSLNPAVGLLPQQICPIGSPVMVITPLEDYVTVSYGYINAIAIGQKNHSWFPGLFYCIDITDWDDAGIEDWVEASDVIPLTISNVGGAAR